jgi:hypothetical protein
MDLDLASVTDALVVPCQSVRFEAAQAYVWRRTSGGFEKRAVEIGLRNDLSAVVKSGLVEGDVIQRDASQQPGVVEQQ